MGNYVSNKVSIAKLKTSSTLNKDNDGIHYEPPKAKFTPLRIEERLLSCGTYSLKTCGTWFYEES